MTYDLAIVGTGFASTFFLLEALRHLPATARVLVLERGQRRTHAWQLAHRTELRTEARRSFTNRNPDKEWRFTLALGGSSACWWACTPRMLPADFELRSRYGVGTDWPVRYDDLEPYYAEVEEAMQVSGPSDGSPFPRSTPYPQPPHRFSTPDAALKRAFPDAFFIQPTARPTRSTPRRGACCASSVCTLCPADAKFTILNELAHLWDDPRVNLITDAFVDEIQIAGNTARGVWWRTGTARTYAHADLVAIGLNAMFNPWLLFRSGLDDGRLGRGLCEQRSVAVAVQLDGMNGYDGSTSITGHGYQLYDGEHRRERAGALVETLNSPLPLIQERRGRWRSQWFNKLIFEDLPQDDNRVMLDPDDPDRPIAVYGAPSAWTQRSIDRTTSLLESVLTPLPVRSIAAAEVAPTEAHVLCTARMGANPAASVVDPQLVHHRVRNLAVLGGSAFPTAAPANPTLTISALSLRAARKMLGAP